ncbi:ComEC/Rec2 family competence protein [Candidatus Woesebacteria bacterium]|nr:ComEC/Rec2 family competence protein [Candidatus Woesebacteria bacterium]
MRYLIWLLLIILIVSRYWTTRPIYKSGQKLRITTIITSDPVKYSDRQIFNTAGLKISLPLYPEINYGDRVVVEGEAADSKLKKAVLVRVEESQGFFPNLRKNLVAFYQKSLPEPHAALLSGIVLGARSSLPKDFWEKLKNSGTLHVVVASGMNVSISAGFFIKTLALFFKRKKAIPFALAGIWGYTAVSGFQAPLIRAAAMGSVAFIAQEFGRVTFAWKILVLAGLMMLIFKPDWIFDIGFILSFVATASLMLFERKIRSFLGFIPFTTIKESFSTSLAAQIGVSPIIFATFGQFNIFSPIINALVLWTVPFIMIIGAVGGVVGIIFEPLGRLILYLVYPLTWWFITIVSM